MISGKANQRECFSKQDNSVTFSNPMPTLKKTKTILYEEL